MTAAKFKRFYARASWAAIPTGEDGRAGGGFRILLDGKAVKTPAKAEMALPMVTVTCVTAMGTPIGWLSCQQFLSNGT